MTDEHWAAWDPSAAEPARRPLVGPRPVDRSRSLPGRVVDGIRGLGFRRTIPVLIVPAVVVGAVGVLFLVTAPSSDSTDAPRLVVTSTALSGAGVAAVGSAQTGAPFVVRLEGEAAGVLSIGLEAPCAELPAVDLVVTTGSAGAVPRSASACAAATDDWEVAELSPDEPVASFTLSAVPAAGQTGPAQWTGRMVLTLGAGAGAVAQDVAMSLTGEGSVVVEDPTVLLPPSSVVTATAPSADRTTTTSRPPSSGTTDSPATTARPSGGGPVPTGSPQRPSSPTGAAPTAGGSSSGGSTGVPSSPAPTTRPPTSPPATSPPSSSEPPTETEAPPTTPPPAETSAPVDLDPVEGP